MRRRRRRTVVVAVEQAHIGPDVQASVSAETDPVEPVELLGRGVNRLLSLERRTGPTGPLEQPPGHALAVTEPPLTYSAPLCQARPATNCGDPGISVALPPLARRRRRWAAPSLRSCRRRLRRRCRHRTQTTSVSLGPTRTSCTWCPFVEVGSGGPEPPSCAIADVPTSTRRAADTAMVRESMSTPMTSETLPGKVPPCATPAKLRPLERSNPDGC